MVGGFCAAFIGLLLLSSARILWCGRLKGPRFEQRGPCQVPPVMADVFTSQKRSQVMARDHRAEAALRSLGWHVVTIWACAVKTRAARDWLAARLPRLIGARAGSGVPADG